MKRRFNVRVYKVAIKCCKFPPRTYNLWLCLSFPLLVQSKANFLYKSTGAEYMNFSRMRSFLLDTKSRYNINKLNFWGRNSLKYCHMKYVFESIIWNNLICWLFGFVIYDAITLKLIFKIEENQFGKEQIFMGFCFLNPQRPQFNKLD